MTELEMIHLYESQSLPLPDMVTLYQKLVERGWVWKMSGKYQAQAVAFINMGLIDRPSDLIHEATLIPASTSS